MVTQSLLVTQGRLRWHRSSACATGECVEVAYWEGLALVRCSRTPEIVVPFPRPQWQAFIASVAASSTGDRSLAVTVTTRWV